MVGTPPDSRLLSDTEVADSWVDAKQVWMQGGFYITLAVVSSSIIASIGFIQWTLASLIIAIVILGVLTMSFRRIEAMRNQLDVIAISTGHPWHDSEEVGQTTVFVLSEGKWIALGADVRIIATRDPLLDSMLLRDGDSEGEIIARWGGDMDSNLVSVINMAQALANAQDRGDDDVDSFEAAREREETSEGVLEREWMDTEEGSIDYEPGAILRAFKRSKDSE